MNYGNVGLLSLSLSLLYRGALKGLCRLNVVLTLSPIRVDLSRRLDTLPRILRTRRNLPSDGRRMDWFIIQSGITSPARA